MRLVHSILLALILSVAAWPTLAAAANGPDNLYCSPGNHAEFPSQDGPATLPQACLYTALNGTPSPGNVISVASGDNLQTALNSAQCGDTVSIQSTATFSGNYVLPARNCTDSSWITVRTSAPDSSLPDEGSRLTPCYAGVASLPNRPDFSCSNPQRVIPQIITNNTQSPITLAKGASHYRLVGLEITRASGTGFVMRLVQATQQADHLIVDRSWVHGTAQDDTRTAVAFSGLTYAAVIDSYLNDIHCTAKTGACTDSHAISGGIGDYPGGPYKVVDNFLEAAGENIFFGGGPAQYTPGDIEIRRNHMYKPLAWMKGQPGFVGGKNGNPFVVKNLTELKNAQRVLYEGNLLEYTWGGFTQVGHFVLLAPKNQMEKKGPSCPICQVTDVTIRYTRMSHGGAGICIAATLTGKKKLLYQAKAAERFSIHDVIVDDVNDSTYHGGGSLFLIVNGWAKNPLNTITINHMTGFGDSSDHLMSILDVEKNPIIENFIFTNNLVLAARYPVWSAGGDNNCANSVYPGKNINRCFKPVSFISNGIIATPDPYPPSTWPAQNDFADTPDAVQFVNYNNGDGGDYHLLSSSPFKNAGTDKQDLGADIDAVLSAIDGVE